LSPVLTKTKNVSKNLRNFCENPLRFSLVAKRVQTDKQDDFNSRSTGMQLNSSAKRNSLWKNHWGRERCQDECKAALDRGSVRNGERCCCYWIL